MSPFEDYEVFPCADAQQYLTDERELRPVIRVDRNFGCRSTRKLESREVIDRLENSDHTTGAKWRLWRKKGT